MSHQRVHRSSRGRFTLSSTAAVSLPHPQQLEIAPLSAGATAVPQSICVLLLWMAKQMWFITVPLPACSFLPHLVSIFA